MADREILNFEDFIQHFRCIDIGSDSEIVNILLRACVVFPKCGSEKLENDEQLTEKQKVEFTSFILVPLLAENSQ